MIQIHPDDLLLFTEISAAMWRVASAYDLPLKSVSGLPTPSRGLYDRLGDCSYTGHIRLVLRCSVNGVWADEPNSPQQVWETGAHELAHLRHMNHGSEFENLCAELIAAMRNQQIDHRQRVIDKLIKMQASRQSEKEIGNTEAAEAFAAGINRMMIEYELNPSDLDYSRATDHDPVVEIPVNFGVYRIEDTKTRSAWMETLARSVANANLCTFLIRSGSNQITFVGTKSHATVAEYIFGTMVPFISKTSKQEEIRYWHETGGGRGVNNQAKGYRASWISGFLTRLWERFAEARRLAVEEAAARQGNSTETGLMRLDGALVKVRTYIDNKFSSKAARGASYISHHSRGHAAGVKDGREAANQIALGKRGIGSGAPPKLIGG